MERQLREELGKGVQSREVRQRRSRARRDWYNHPATRHQCLRRGGSGLSVRLCKCKRCEGPILVLWGSCLVCSGLRGVCCGDAWARRLPEARWQDVGGSGEDEMKCSHNPQTMSGRRCVWQGLQESDAGDEVNDSGCAYDDEGERLAVEEAIGDGRLVPREMGITEAKSSQPQASMTSEAGNDVGGSSAGRRDDEDASGKARGVTIKSDQGCHHVCWRSQQRHWSHCSSVCQFLTTLAAWHCQGGWRPRG